MFRVSDPECFDFLDEVNLTNTRDSAVLRRSDVREILELSPHWTKWPDYERVRQVTQRYLSLFLLQVAWINRLIAALWPHYNHAIANIVHETVTPILEQMCGNVIKI